MIYLGIDVAKNKHDCCIINKDGEILADVFTIPNNKAGFSDLLNRINHHVKTISEETVTAGIEATGHYSNNIERFLREHDICTNVLNPLNVNLLKKASTLRKTKTDKVDAMFIAKTLANGLNHRQHPVQSDETSDLRQLCRHRMQLVLEQSRRKTRFHALMDQTFPELETICGSIYGKGYLNMLLELPTAKDIAGCHLTHLTTLLKKYSGGYHGLGKATQIRELARDSIGKASNALAFEIRQMIRLIINHAQEIFLLEQEIKKIVQSFNTPILSVPGISYTLAAIILSEIGDVSYFATPAKLLAFAGLEPSTYQSGNFTATTCRMVKRGSKYLRYALLTAAKIISRHDQNFAQYLSKKRAEGNHYNVAISHVSKKLTRIIFHILTTGEDYMLQAT
jgi:transposase